MKKTLFSLAISFCLASVASASGFGAGGSIDVSGYTGTGGGYASTATNGGSMAQGNVNGTGYSAQFTSNAGSGYAGAATSVGNSGVVTHSFGGIDFH